jgi:hypothetical protein
MSAEDAFFWTAVLGAAMVVLGFICVIGGR